ncbi:protein trachealess-like isoform X2 [Lineus longissimus]|uniref:protein trachealess-like isoform X2 n=1 Tax=Lineus longissimus TaxID=88925 RepID=UPI00315C8191
MLSPFIHVRGSNQPCSQDYIANSSFPVILELRKEKSRDAARSRRGKENYEFYELAKMLPLPGAITSQLDKASIIRLTISYLKLRDFSSHGDPPWNRDGPPPNKSVKGGPPRRRSSTGVAMEIFESTQGTHILQSLDGFAFALANDGRFLYISETVSIYLGLSQVEMEGSSIFDYVHVQDHNELSDQLGLCMPPAAPMPSPGSDEGSASSQRAQSPSPLAERGLMNPNPLKGVERSFHIRMKSTLTKRGVHVKTAGYRVVHILGQFRPQFSFSLTRKHPPPLLGMVAIALALPPPTVNELKIDNDMFVMRLSPDFKIVFCEPRISDLMDLTADDLMTKNLYEYTHAEDLQKLRRAHVDLLTKGQVLTDYFRILNQRSGYVWMQMCATIIYNNKNSDEENVICVCYVLSGIEHRNCVMDSRQLSHMKNRNQGDDNSDNSESETGSDHVADDVAKDKNTKTSGDKAADHVDQSGSGDQSKHSLVEESGILGDSDHYRYQNGEDDIDSSDFGAENGSVGYLDDISEKYKGDIKNSRRKMGRPRKRKRDPSPEENGVDGDYNSRIRDGEPACKSVSPPLENGAILKSAQILANLPTTTEENTHSAHKMSSPTPEDLSVKAMNTSVATRISPMDAVTSGAENTQDWQRSTSNNMSTSVRDLEQVMNKHLPNYPQDADQQSATYPTDYSSSSYAKQRSTIQWIGSQQPQPETLPASTLLRHLYANRESVIRMNTYNQSRPQYYGDMQNSMLTPPGTEAYKDQSQFSLPQLSVVTKSQPGSAYSLAASYNSSVHEPYSITPPSSVSPQDKYQSSFTDPASYTDSNSNQLKLYGNETGSQIPLKPHVYPIPSPTHAHSSYDRNGSQYSKTAAFYRTGSSYSGAYAHSNSPSAMEEHYRHAKTSSW